MTGLNQINDEILCDYIEAMRRAVLRMDSADTPVRVKNSAENYTFTMQKAGGHELVVLEAEAVDRAGKGSNICKKYLMRAQECSAS